MKMKWMRLFSLLLALTLLLSACGKKAQQEEPEADSEVRYQPEEEVEDKSLLWGDLLSSGGAADVPGEEPADDPAESETEPEPEPEPEPEIAAVRYWDCAEQGISMTLYSDGTGTLSDYTYTMEMTYTETETTITLLAPEEGESLELLKQDDGSLIVDGDADVLLPVDAPTYTEENAPAPEITAAEFTITGDYNYQMEGHWDYFGDDSIWMEFDGVGRVSFDLGDISGSGDYRYDSEDLEILTDSGRLLQGYTDYEDDVWLDDYDKWFIVDEENYFKENGLYTNWEASGWAIELENGGRYYYEDGSEYHVRTVEWEIIEDGGSNTGDGYRFVDLTLLCGFLAEQNPQLEGEYMYGCQFGLFDAYTGYRLVDNDVYYDASLDAYVYEFESNGENVRIEYNYTVDWQSDRDGYEDCLVAGVHIRIPEHYDGLRIVALVSEPTHDEYLAGFPIALKPYELLYQIDDGMIYEID